MIPPIIFIYYNKYIDKIKVLQYERAIIENKELLESGWKHTQTLHTSMWIENICNNLEDDEILNAIKELKK